METSDSLLEPVGISPRVDCVFKALMGDPANKAILLDFLQAVIEPEVPIVEVEVRNPSSLPDFLGDHYVIVDVKATDAQGRTFQVEMQSWNEPALKERMLFTWADLYQSQIVSGQSYSALTPVISIWLLDENTLRNAPDFHHRFLAHDPVRDVCLTTHFEIHTLELDKWRARPDALCSSGDQPGGVFQSPAIARWMTFFAEAETWPALPDVLRSPSLEAAMAVLERFRSNAQWNEVYRARLDDLRRQRTIEVVMAETQAALEQALADKDHALAAKEQERAAKEQERAAKEQEQAAKEQALDLAERLRARLRALGIDPD